MKVMLALSAVLIAGCASETRVRREAALTLGCDEVVTVVEVPAYQSWIAEGCGRQSVCALDSRDRRAEVFCAGRAPARVLR